MTHREGKTLNRFLVIQEKQDLPKNKKPVGCQLKVLSSSVKILGRKGNFKKCRGRIRS